MMPIPNESRTVAIHALHSMTRWKTISRPVRRRKIAMNSTVEKPNASEHPTIPSASR
jgi:hypothetical protein